MSTERPTTWPCTHGRPALRIGTAALLFGPGVGKFVTYDRSVSFFTTLGLPAPELLVLVIGSLEIGAALSLSLDRVLWLGALLTIPIMAVAIATAGPSWQNLGVLLASSIVLGTSTHVLAVVR